MRKLSDLETRQSAPEFWNDQEEANRVLRRVQALKQWTVPLGEASTQAEELALLAEMAGEEEDDEEEPAEVPEKIGRASCRERV